MCDIAQQQQHQHQQSTLTRHILTVSSQGCSPTRVTRHHSTPVNVKPWGFHIPYRYIMEVLTESILTVRIHIHHIYITVRTPSIKYVFLLFLIQELCQKVLVYMFLSESPVWSIRIPVVCLQDSLELCIDSALPPGISTTSQLAM